MKKILVLIVIVLSLFAAGCSSKTVDNTEIATYPSDPALRFSMDYQQTLADGVKCYIIYDNESHLKYLYVVKDNEETTIIELAE